MLERTVEKLTRDCVTQVHSTDRAMRTNTENYQARLREQVSECVCVLVPLFCASVRVCLRACWGSVRACYVACILVC